VRASPPWPVGAVDVVPLDAFSGVTGGEMVAWEGDYTNLNWDYAACRMETQSVRFEVTEWLPSAASEAEAGMHCCTDPVHLLCRAMRMAPASCDRFELAVARPNAPLRLEADVTVCWGARTATAVNHARRNQKVSFDSIAELATALRIYAAAEGVSVFSPPDAISERFVGLLRNGAQGV